MGKFFIVGALLLIFVLGGAIGLYTYQRNSQFLEYILLGDQYYHDERYIEAFFAYQHAAKIKTTADTQERLHLAQQAAEMAVAEEKRRITEQTSGAFTKKDTTPLMQENIAPQPIPRGVDARTQEDFNYEKYLWMIRHIAEVYEEADKCDEAAKQFLVNLCRFETHQESAVAPMELERTGETIVGSGCTEPLILLGYGRLLTHHNQFQKAEPVLKRASRGLQKRKYPKIPTFFVNLALSESLRNQAGKHKQAEDSLQKALEVLNDAIRNDEFAQTEVPIAFRLVQDMYHDEWFNFSPYEAMIIQLKHTPTEDSWLLNMFIGEDEVDKAWAARGKSAAGDVATQGWQGFREHLGNAREHLLEAWKLHPEYPEAAARMITLAMAGHANPGETERLWFDRAVAAQMDYALAYENFQYALFPQWGGRQKEMYAFGLECLETERFDTDVPMFYLDTLRVIGAHLTGYRFRSVFRSPEVQENLRQLFEGMLAEPARVKERYRILAQQTFAETWCGNYEKAKLMLPELNPNINLKDGFWRRPFSFGMRSRAVVAAELRAFTGSQEHILLEAERLHLANRTEEALPLFESAMNAYKQDEEVYAYLRRRIARMKMGYRSRNINSRMTAIHMAVYGNRADVVEFLLNNGMNANLLDERGRSPLNIAVSKNYPEITNLLVKNGADVNKKGGKDWTALHYAASRDDTALATLLIEHGAAMNAKTNIHRTPLHQAASRGNLEFVKLLLKNGAEIDVQDNKLWTPLHLSCYYDHIDTVKYLVKKGANKYARINSGHTPKQLAESQRNFEIADILE